MITASIIITSYNNAHILKECIESLLNQDYKRKEVTIEIIFVDSGSQDNSKLVLNKYRNRIKILFKPLSYSNHPQFSPAQARNIGSKHASGKFLLFSDSDCVLPKTWVSKIIEFFKNYPIDCIIGNREPDVGKGLGTFIRRYDFILYSNKFTIEKPIIINTNTLKEKYPLVLLAGNNFAIKKTVWDKLGGMKTIFKNPAGEDIMLEIDLLKKGYTLMFIPKIKVIHNHPISLKKLFKRAFQNGEATYLLTKHSNHFVTWRNFYERGRNFSLYNFMLGVITVCLLVLFSLFFKISPVIIFVLFLEIYLIFFIVEMKKTSKKLRMVTMKGEKKYFILSNISLFELFFFVKIHLILKTIATFTILWQSLTRK